jgi:hypothetical protein
MVSRYDSKRARKVNELRRHPVRPPYLFVPYIERYARLPGPLCSDQQDEWIRGFSPSNSSGRIPINGQMDVLPTHWQQPALADS